MEKFTYRLSTISSLIVTPRANLALYVDLKDFSGNQIQENSQFLLKKNLKVIYPFYQYGEYDGYNPSGASYYLPGSSLKGALCQKKYKTSKIMVDDVLIPNDDIVLRNIFKAQYLEEENEACISEFFDKVGVEMIKAGVELVGEIYLEGLPAFKELIDEAKKSTQIKINQMLDYLYELETKSYKEGMKTKLHKVSKQLSLLQDISDDVLLLGGYKGLLHSMELNSNQDDITGAVYVDPETDLPHGIIKLELI